MKTPEVSRFIILTPFVIAAFAGLLWEAFQPAI